MDVWKWVALGFFILGFVVLPFYSYSHSWSIYPIIFCWFITVLALLVSVFSKRGSTVWHHRGQG